MKKNLFKALSIFLICLYFTSFAQTGGVGINTSAPNGATVLDIYSSKKGILIPRLSNAERDANLADNDRLTVPPAGVVNTKITPGVLIYNTTTNGFQYWDGVLWKQVFASENKDAGNDGVVKINSGAGGVKPTYNLDADGSTYGLNAQVLYTTPLVFANAPVTNWPENTVPYPGVTSNIYYESGTPLDPALQRWRENEVQGQVHVWRIIATVTPDSNTGGSVRASFVNPDTSFKVTSVEHVPNGSTKVGNVLTFYFYTVADSGSLDPGKGYQFFVQADIKCTLVIDSITRISLFKD